MKTINQVFQYHHSLAKSLTPWTLRALRLRAVILGSARRSLEMITPSHLHLSFLLFLIVVCLFIVLLFEDIICLVVLLSIDLVNVRVILLGEVLFLRAGHRDVGPR